MDPSPTLHPSFRVNQTGYAAGLPVHAVALMPGEVSLTDAGGNIVRKIRLETAPLDEASGERAALVDFGCLAPGEYVLSGAFGQRKIEVSERPWRNVTNALMKGFYFQRCGCHLTRACAGDYAHPACHTAPAVDWLDRAASRRVIGGWHDAGDYGKYVGPGAVTVAHLLYAWKLFPEGCGDALNIPETGSGIPDILSEAL